MKKIALLILIFPFFALQILKDEVKFSSKKLKKEFAFIPSGRVVVGNDTSSVQAFHISKFEVTNGEYHIFLNDLKAKNRLEEYKVALPDTTKWHMKLSFSDAFKDYYFSHPAYVNYPVVCVSFEGAELYCKWFTEKMNEISKEKEVKIFRLPYREEFIRAARGENLNSPYAWNGPYVRNHKGQILCNHVHVDLGESKVDLTSANTDILAPSKSYWPNQFGIYNLNGNVAEMTFKKGISTGGSWRNEAKDVQNESIMTYEEASPMLGFRLVSTKSNFCPAK